MRQRPDTSGYLEAADGTSWDACKGQIPDGVVTNTELDDFNYLYMGKHFWTTKDTQNWRIWETFLRFPTSAIRDSHEIVSAALRLYVYADGSDTEFGLILGVLDDTYGELDKADWMATHTEFTSITMGAAIEQDAAGNSYVDIPFTAEMLALISKTAGSTIDLILRGNEVTEPTDGQYLAAYSHQYATETLRPHLHIVTKGLRQQMFEALESTLDTIDEFDGYTTTPAVSINFKGMDAVTKTQCPAIFILTDEEVRELTSYRVDEVNWNPYLLAVVRNPDESTLAASINELADDIECCLGRNPQLGLEGGIQWVRIQRLDTTPGLTMDSNHTCALVTLDIKYLAHINEP